MAPLHGRTRIRSLRRFGKISRVLFKHGFGDVLDRMAGRGGRTAGDEMAGPGIRSGLLSPVRLRRALEELGPSFIKLGQLMSTRADVFPLDYIEELKKLQDSVPAVPTDEIRRILATELGESVDKVFWKFSDTPVAAASIAQVHRAERMTGEVVAVKVVRPGIRKTLRDDIGLMYAFAERFERTFELGRIMGAVNIVREFERTVFRELDMLIEAGNIEKFAANFKRIDEIKIPRVFWEHTTKSVLVMEYIEGIKMDRVDAIREQGTDPKEVALIGLRSFSRQLMEFGYFHADPHPANVIVLPDGRVGLVDFGITGYLDEELMHQIAFLFLGFAEHDYEMVIAALTEAGIVDQASVDIKAFRSDLMDISEPFYGRSLQTVSVMDVYEQIMQLIYKYHIHMPRNLLLLLKTFIQTEALGKILGSDASLLEITRPYARRLIHRAYDAQKLLRNLGTEARGLAGQLRHLPRFMTDILRRTAEGRHRMELRHTGFELLERRIERGINRLIVGIIIAASTIAGALVLNASMPPINVSLNAFGLKTVSLTALLGISGYTIATVLGIWLILSIFRSGKM